MRDKKCHELNKSHQRERVTEYLLMTLRDGIPYIHNLYTENSIKLSEGRELKKGEIKAIT